MPARLLSAALACFLAASAFAQMPAAVVADGVDERPLFAVEIKTGPNWDAAKPAQEQAFFREHSANLKRLRDAGALVMGARYSDKGLVVLAEEDIVAVKAMMDADASVSAGTFVYEAHPFNVFYAGTVRARPRK